MPAIVIYLLNNLRYNERQRGGTMKKEKSQEGAFGKAIQKLKKCNTLIELEKVLKELKGTFIIQTEKMNIKIMYDTLLKSLEEAENARLYKIKKLNNTEISELIEENLAVIGLEIENQEAKEFYISKLLENEHNKILEKISNETKKQWIVQDKYSKSIQEDIFESIQDERIKKDLLKLISQRNEKALEKGEYMSLYNIEKLIAMLKDDKEKLQFYQHWKPYLNETEKEIVIKSIKQELTKKELFEELLNQIKKDNTNEMDPTTMAYVIDRMIASFEDPDEKMNFYFQYIKPKERIEFLNGMIESKEYEKKIETFSSLKSNSQIEYVYKKYKDYLTPYEKLYLIFQLGFDQEGKKLKRELIRDSNINFSKLQAKIIQGINQEDQEFLNLPEDLNWGLELEVAGYTTKESRNLLFFLNNSLEEKWKVEEENDVFLGTEFVSPVMKTNMQTKDEVAYLLSMIRVLNYTITNRCGLHVSYGGNYLNSLPAWQNFVNIWLHAEELIYKMSNGVGKFPRPLVRYRAKPKAIFKEDDLDLSKIEFHTIRDLEEFINKCKDKGRFYGLNLSNIGEGEDRVEIRISNMDNDCRTILQTINFYGKIFVVSRENAIQPGYKQKEFAQFMRNDLSEKEKVDAFLNLLFEEEKEKELYYNRWESMKDEHWFDSLNFPEQFFRRNDFSQNMQENDRLISIKERNEIRKSFPIEIRQTNRNELVL